MLTIREHIRRALTTVVASAIVALTMPLTEAAANGLANDGRMVPGEEQPSAAPALIASLIQSTSCEAASVGDGCAPDPDAAQCKEWDKDCHYSCNKNSCVKEGRGCSACHDCCSRQLSKCMNKDRRTDFGGCQ